MSERRSNIAFEPELEIPLTEVEAWHAWRDGSVVWADAMDRICQLARPGTSDEDFEAPTPDALERAFLVVRSLEAGGEAAPARTAGDGFGGICFEWDIYAGLRRICIDATGDVSGVVLRNDAPRSFCRLLITN